MFTYRKRIWREIQVWVLLMACVGALFPQMDVQAQEPFTPYIEVVHYHHISLREFTPESTVTLAVFEEPGGAVVLEESISTDAEGNGEYVWLRVDPGMYISAWDDSTGIEKTLTVEEVYLGSIDILADQVTGVAPPGSIVTVQLDRDVPIIEALSDPSGVWLADYGALGVDVVSRDFVTASRIDPDGDRTTTVIPFIEASVSGDWIDVYRYDLDPTVHIELYDFELGTLLFSTDVPIDEWGEGKLEPADIGVDLLPGMFITSLGTVTGIAKSVTLAEMSFDIFDLDLDYAEGHGPPESLISVGAGLEPDYYNFQDHPVDEFGVWVADFASVGFDLVDGMDNQAIYQDEDGDNTSAEYHPVSPDSDEDGVPDESDNCPDFFNPDQEDGDFDGVGDVCDICPDHFNPDQADENENGLGDACEPDKHIIAHAQYDPAVQDMRCDQVDGSSWDLGSMVTLTIDDVSTGPGVDFVFTQEAHETEVELITVSFPMEDFDLQPGDILTMSDGLVTETHVVQPQTITSVDVETDIIEGFAPAGEEVIVWFEYPGFAEEIVTADETTGYWFVDFSLYGLDVAYGSGGAAVMNDPIDSSSHTRFNWNFDHTHIEATETFDQVGFHAFTPFNTISVEVYESVGGTLLEQWDLPTDGNGHAFLELDGVIDLVPGSYIWARDQATNLVKDLELYNLSLDIWEPENGYVAGTADPGQEVQVNVYQEGYEGPDEFMMRVTADGGGHWEAVFEDPFPEEMWPAVRIFDPDNDESVAEFRHEPPPYFECNLTWDWINLQRFTPETTAMLEIYDSEGGALLDTFYIPINENGEGWMENFEHGYDLVPGMFLQVTDEGGMIKGLSLQPLSLEVYDVDNDYLSGFAPPEAKLWVNVHDEVIEEGYGMEVGADETGFWEADFAGIVDLRYELMSAAVFLPDEDEDATVAEWPGFGEMPTVEASLTYDWINFFGFEPDSEILLTIDGFEFTVPTFEEGGYWMDRYEHMIDLVPGILITATQGDIYKELVLQDIGISAVDLDLDEVSGFGPPDDKIEVNAWNEEGGYGFGMEVPIDAGGEWTAAFAEDITEAFHIGALMRDEDNDATIAEVPPLPFFTAGRDGNYVQAMQWPIGSEVTLSIPEESYSTTALVEPAPFDPFTGFAFFDLGGIVDITPGMEIFVEGSGYLKDHIVRSITITQFDTDADTISGTGVPYEMVFLAVTGPGGEWLEIQRWTQVDPSGQWLVDLSVPGPGKGEENIHDLQPGDQGFAQELDEDEDSTEIHWYINTPPVLQEISASLDPVSVGTPIDVSATFSDPDEKDSWTALWEWGDGEFSEGSISDFTILGNHSYDLPGVYTLTVTVTDSYGASDTMSFQYIVVYDPDGGFVTGGGWIYSPAGAYVLDESLEGKATFGFVSKYKKGTTIPDGQTHFTFTVADFNFHSSSYDWLVIAWSKAIYKGVGTINGMGEYKFMISAIDGDRLGDQPDKFRIKIWADVDGEEQLVYDNQLGADIGEDPTTVLGGGSIVIHKK